jgi:hypothetical protein
MHKVLLIKNNASFDPPSQERIQAAIEAGAAAGSRFVQLATEAVDDARHGYILFLKSDIFTAY